MGRIATLSLCLTIAGSGALHAERAFDLVFRTGTLDGLPQGTELRYDGDGTSEAQSDEDWHRLVVGLTSDNQARVERQAEEGPSQVLGSFRSTLGNPVAMVFLERTVRDISETTGGSPFYIRNRIRDALAGSGQVETVTVDWNGEAVPATEIALVPFLNDARRAELGAFADLEIRVVVSEGVPGWYHSISAEIPASAAGTAYAMSLSLAEVEP